MYQFSSTLSFKTLLHHFYIYRALEDFCLSPYISFPNLFLNENFRNTPLPNDIYSENNEENYESEKIYNLVDDHVQLLNGLSDDENGNRLDGNGKEPQQKFEKDNHESSQDQKDVEQSISKGK